MPRVGLLRNRSFVQPRPLMGSSGSLGLVRAVAGPPELSEGTHFIGPDKCSWQKQPPHGDWHPIFEAVFVQTSSPGLQIVGECFIRAHIPMVQLDAITPQERLGTKLVQQGNGRYAVEAAYSDLLPVFGCFASTTPEGSLWASSGTFSHVLRHRSCGLVRTGPLRGYQEVDF